MERLVVFAVIISLLNSYSASTVKLPNALNAVHLYSANGNVLASAWKGLRWRRAVDFVSGADYVSKP